MLLLLLIYVVLSALWKRDVHLISTLVNKSLNYYYYYTIMNRSIILYIYARQNETVGVNMLMTK